MNVDMYGYVMWYTWYTQLKTYREQVTIAKITINGCYTNHLPNIPK